MFQKVVTDCTLSVLKFCLQKPIYLQGRKEEGEGGVMGALPTLDKFNKFLRYQNIRSLNL